MGLAEDPIVIAFDAFLAAILLGVGMFIMVSFQNTGLWSGGIALEVLNLLISSMAGFDWLIAIGLVMYAIASIALAYFIPSNPMFFFNYFTNLIGAFVVVPQISNIYASIASLPLMATAYATFPKTAWIVGNLPIFVVLLMSILAIVTYGKSNQAGGIAQG